MPPVEQARDVRIAVNRRVADLVRIPLSEALFESDEHVCPE